MPRRGSSTARRLGHYLGATLYFEGEWYWGVDRLRHLEVRLRAAGLVRAAAAPWIVQLPGVGCRHRPTNGHRPALYFYCSLRSPYTWVAVERVVRLAECYDAPDAGVRPADGDARPARAAREAALHPARRQAGGGGARPAVRPHRGSRGLADGTRARGTASRHRGGSANRDERHWDRPDEFVLGRPNLGDHLAFGFGEHYCAGSFLGRLEARVAVQALFDRLPNLRLAPGEPATMVGLAFRSLDRLPVLFGPEMRSRP